MLVRDLLKDNVSMTRLQSPKDEPFPETPRQLSDSERTQLGDQMRKVRQPVTFLSERCIISHPSSRILTSKPSWLLQKDSFVSFPVIQINISPDKLVERVPFTKY